MKVKVNNKNKKQVLKEINEDEYALIEDALEIPISELPYSNIFGNRYRVLGDFETVNKGHPIYEMVKFFQDNDWVLNTQEGNKSLTFSKTWEYQRPDSNNRMEMSKTIQTKSITLKLQNLIPKMIAFYTESLPKLYNQYFEAFIKSAELKRKAADLMAGADTDEGYKEWYKANEAFQKAKMFEVSKSATMRSTINKFLGTSYKTIPAVQIANPNTSLTAPIIEKLQGFQKAISDEAQLYRWQQDHGDLFIPCYVIFSRHPIDVFRMSDHVQIRSCHTPPSSAGEVRFDQYNICALAEAWANGMIAYAVEVKQFEQNNIQPTQQDIDQYEDSELFWDRTRGEGVISPIARVRIRNTSFTDPETGEVTQIGVPDQKVYGTDIGGFKEYVRSHISGIQKSSLQKIFNATVEAGTNKLSIPLGNFERFGGSYEDNGASIRSNLSLMFATALDFDAEGIETSGDIRYDKSIQNELEERANEGGAGLEILQIQADEEAEAASRNTRWHFDVSLDLDYEGDVYIEEILLTVFAVLPESVNVGDNYTAINEAFADYIDRFNLYWGNEEVTPDSIAAYAPSTFMTHNFTKPFIAIRYPNLAEISYNMGERIAFGELPGELANMADTSRNGGLNLALVTDPYIEDAFDAVARDICALRDFYDDPEWYLNQAYHQTIDQTNWLVDSVSEGETMTMLEIVEEVSYDTIMNIDLKQLIKRGKYTPKQAAAILIAIGESEELQQWLIREINKECQISVGNGESFINNNETVIPFTIDVPQTYQTVEDVLADIDAAGDDSWSSVQDHFQLKMTVTKDQIDSSAKFLALYSLLSQYDQDEMATLILAYSDEIKNLFPAEPQAVTENKRRMKIRMLRG